MLLDSDDNSCCHCHTSTTNDPLPNYDSMPYNHTLPDNNTYANKRSHHLQEILLPIELHSYCQGGEGCLLWNIWLLCGPMLPDSHNDSCCHCHSSPTNHPLPNYNSMPYNHAMPHNPAAHMRGHRVPKANGDEAKPSEDRVHRIQGQSLQLCGMLLGANDNSCPNHNARPNNHALPNNHTLPNYYAYANLRSNHMQKVLLPSRSLAGR